jgi:hypothetical protein
MSKTDSIDAFSLIRIGTFSAELERLHLWGTDEEIDREFNSVCRTIWDNTLDDFDDDSISRVDHDWLDDLTAPQAYRYAARASQVILRRRLHDSSGYSMILRFGEGDHPHDSR